MIYLSSSILPVNQLKIDDRSDNNKKWNETGQMLQLCRNMIQINVLIYIEVIFEKDCINHWPFIIGL